MKEKRKFIMILGALILIAIMIKPNISSDSSISIEESPTIRIEGQSISISKIEALNEYLEKENFNPVEIERLRIDSIFSEGENITAHIGYGCGNKSCHNVLVQVSDKEVSSIVISDGIYMKSIMSENKSRFLIQYGSNEGGTVIRSAIIGVNLHPFKKLSMVSNEHLEMYGSEPIVPIVEAVWLDNQTVTILVANISDTKYENLEKWFQASQPDTKQIEISFTM